MTTQFYTAETARGHRIVTVIATSREDARQQIVEQLACRPGRMWYYQAWQQDGRIITLRQSMADTPVPAT